MACQAAGDSEGAREVYSRARQLTGVNRMMVSGVLGWSALAPLACGDLDSARQWADDAVGFSFGCYLSVAHMARAQVKFAQNDIDGAEQDVQAALSGAMRTNARCRMSPTLDCLGRLRPSGEPT